MAANTCVQLEIIHGKESIDVNTHQYENKECTKCKNIKELKEFPPRTKGKLGRDSRCYECHKIINMEKKNTFDGFMQKLLTDAKSSAKRRLNKGRLEAGICNLTKDQLITLWTNQNGKCYYSGIQMNTRPCSDWMCSLERLDNNIGYIFDNVVFACLEFNGKTKWTLDKIKQIPLLVNDQGEDIALIQEIDNALNKRSLKGDSKRPVITNDMGYYSCNKCNTFKPIIEFTTQINKGCKICQKVSRQLHYNTIRGHLQHLFKHAKEHTIMRDNVKSRVSDNSFNITFEDLVNILRNQRGRCAYSNIRMNYGSTIEKDWIASLERIDPRKGYVKDNICLICAEFNGSDHTTKIKYSNGGSGGWSIEKFKLFFPSISSH